MAELVLGPLLRYADVRAATIWVETDRACEVEILGRRAQTFHVAGHHYALLAIEGLEPGVALAYTVALDGVVRWPDPALPGPPSTLAILEPQRPLSLAFGSCRVAAPHEAPWTLPRGQDARGRGPDALRALAQRLRAQDRAEWPTLLLMVGDQVYADDAGPQTRAVIRSRRRADRPPGEGVADFEEYTQLYREAWSDPDVRWLLATVPSAMIFDDHEVIDDWNVSAAWWREMEARPWWSERVGGALMSYWIYQHLGNLSPAQLREEPLYRAVAASDDGAPLIREFALQADRGGAGARWSYSRRLGNVQLVVVDSRAGRVLGPGRREMLDDEQWDWLDQELHGDVEHLLLVTSLPYLLPFSIHAAESWSEAVAGGAWGSAAARLAERLRRMIDLEHWAAFADSFERVARMLAQVGAGDRGRPPASIVLLSGDVHYGYLAQATFRHREIHSAVYQAVASPFRQGLSRPMKLANRLAFSRLSAALGLLVLWSVGLRRPSVRWRVRRAPVFETQVATLELDGRRAFLRLESVDPAAATLRTAFAAQLVSTGG